MSSDSVDLLNTTTAVFRGPCCGGHTVLRTSFTDGPTGSSRTNPLGCEQEEEEDQSGKGRVCMRHLAGLSRQEQEKKEADNMENHDSMSRTCRCHHSCSGFFNDVAAVTPSSSLNDDDKERVDNDDTDECGVYVGRLPRYIPQPSTSVLPRSRSEFERLNACRHPTRSLVLACCYGNSSTHVTPDERSKKLVDTWSGELQPLSPYEVARVGRRGRGGYEGWRVEDVMGSRKVLVTVTVLVALLGALVGLIGGLAILEQGNTSRGGSSQESACASDHVRCGDVGCVHIRFVCAGLQWQCPDILDQLDCPNNESKLANEIWEELERETNQEEYITVTSEQEKPIRDAGGWVMFSRGSSSGSKYIVVHKSMTFNGAQDQCRKHGGYLAHVNSLREQIFLEEFLKDELKIDVFPSDGLGFWIGARRPRGGHGGTCMYDQWKWVDAYGRSHGSIAGFTAFIPGKPDNYYGPEECLYMTYKEGNDETRFLKWDDAPCDLNSIGSIKSVCEVELI